MNEYYGRTRTRRRSGPDDTIVPNKMKSGDSSSSGSDKLLTLVVELQLQLAESNKLLLEKKELSKLFLIKEIKLILVEDMVRWNCVLKKLLVEEKEHSKESNRVLQELLRKENERYELLHKEENERQKKRSKESNRELLRNKEKKRSKRLELLKIVLCTVLSSY